MAIKIQLRRGTEAEFNNSNPTLVDGEVAIVQPDGTTGGYIVIGNGSSDWNTLKADADGRFYYMPGYSKTQMGGVQGSGDTPLTVTGASGQSVPIFVVEDNSGNDIFKVSDDESSDSAALVAIESRGQTADVVLSVFGQADQDDDNSGGDLLRVQPDAGQVGKGLSVDHSGNVSIVPVDDDGVTDTALKVRASGNSDNPIMRVQESNGDDLFKIAQGSSVFVKTLNLGTEPNHADPANHGVIRSHTTPNNTDSGAADDSLIDRPHFRLKSENSGTAIRGKLELNGNSGSSAANAIAITRSGGSGSGEITMDYAGNLEASGKATLADAEIDTTSRTTNAASVLRKDEIESTVAGTSGPFYYCITRNDADIPTGANLLFPFVIGSAPHNFTTSIVSSDSPALTLLPITGTNSDIQTGHDSSDNDTTNAYILKVPANSGSMAMRLQYQGPFSGGSDINGTARVRQYTAQTLESSTFEYNIMELVDTTDTALILTRTAVIPNRTTDRFYAISFDGSHSTGGSSDALHIDLLVARNVGDFEAIPDNSDPTSINLKAT